MSANENAEAILIVIKKIFRWIAMAVLALIGLFIIIFSWSKFSDWYKIDRHKNNIKVVALFDKKICDDKNFPLLIGVVNNSSKTIEKISINIKVTKTGFSSKLNGWGNFDYDKIIKPGESWGLCWSVNSADYGKPNLDGNDMDAVVEYFSPTFSDK